MSEKFAPLSRDELLADIITISEDEDTKQLRREMEKAEKAALREAAEKKEKPKKEAAAPKQGKQKASSDEKQKATRSKTGGKKPKGSAAEKNVPETEPAVEIDERTRIVLPPVTQAPVLEPVIVLPPQSEAAIPAAPIIGLTGNLHDYVDDEDSDEFEEEKRSKSAILFCAIRRFLLTLFVVIGLLAVGLYMVLNLIFNGPSPTARDALTMSLSEASGTKWVPGLFLDDQLVEEIRRGDTTLLIEDEATADLPPIEINTDTSLTANSDEWKDCPDGIRIEKVSGDTYNAYVMLVRDPSKVYLATSTKRFSRNIPGKRITEQIEIEGAIAAVNAGAFYDNGTSDPDVGSIPQGLTVSQGKVVWDSGKAPEKGFAGFNQDNVLVVADTMTEEDVQRLGIRDGCSFGPVLIQNGAIRYEAYNSASGYNPRTAIGQRADGSVILLCIDGRQSQSIGGTYADIIDIMVEYGAVNACNLDGGSSTTMLYRDETGRYGTAGQVHMINNYSLLQSQPRKMPTFIMVRPDGEE